MTPLWLERGIALGATVIIPLALRVLPLPAVLAVCDRWPRVAPRAYTPAQLAGRVHRWLTRGRGPWTSTCLTRSLVLYAMLRQHGHLPHFMLGVTGTARAFDAHAWVVVDGEPVADPADVSGTFRQLMSHHA